MFEIEALKIWLCVKVGAYMSKISGLLKREASGILILQLLMEGLS